MKTTVRRLIYEPIGGKDNGPEIRIRAHISNLCEQDPTLSDATSSIANFLTHTPISGASNFIQYYDLRNKTPNSVEVFHVPTDRAVIRLRCNPLHPETKGGRA